MRCKFFHSKCVPRTKKDIFKNYKSAENVSTIVLVFTLSKFLNTEMSCSYINVKVRLAKMC